MKLSKIAVIDIETTGLKKTIDLIIEIGIVELDLDTGDTKVIFDSLVREPEFGEKHRNSWIFDNSDMTFEEIEKAPLLQDLFDEIQDILKKYPTTAFNKDFDLGFLKLRGFKVPDELPCIMKTATNICKIPFPNGGGYYEDQQYKWPKVEEAWNYFFSRIDYNEEHRAADDATHESKILYELYNRGCFNFKE